MFYLLKILLILINVDSEMILNWFGLQDFMERRNLEIFENNPKLTNLESSTEISLDTFRLIIHGFWYKIQDGLTLSDIENIIFFIVFFRFIILANRYNLKTSFFITCIGLFAGYLWYKHLIDIILAYSMVLIRLPFLNKLGIDAIKLTQYQLVLGDLSFKDINWYSPGQIIYYAFTNGIRHTDFTTGFQYYIDPISMIISNLKEPQKSTFAPFYYRVYNSIIPNIISTVHMYWTQLVPVVSYTFLTRVGKRFCPYFIRWHWTCLMIIKIIEPIYTGLMNRIYYFQSFVLIPQTQVSSDPSLILQINILNNFIAISIIAHIIFTIFGLLHAIAGQYFYFPILVDNTERHVGLRPNTLYSGGLTPWQDEYNLIIGNKMKRRVFPKLWYGWFGRESKGNYIGSLIQIIVKVCKRNLKRLRKTFRKFL